MQGNQPPLALFDVGVFMQQRAVGEVTPPVPAPVPVAITHGVLSATYGQGSQHYPRRPSENSFTIVNEVDMAMMGNKRRDGEDGNHMEWDGPESSDDDENLLDGDTPSTAGAWSVSGGSRDCSFKKPSPDRSWRWSPAERGASVASVANGVVSVEAMVAPPPTFRPAGDASRRACLSALSAITSSSSRASSDLPSGEPAQHVT